MTTGARLFLAAAILYAGTGFYVVGGNEKAAVRRFGRFTGSLQTSGLHYDWPFPFCRVDRLNFAAVNTVTVGTQSVPTADAPLGRVATATPAFLTGDQNLLHVRAQILYRPRETEVTDYLYGQVSPETQLAHLAKAILADLMSRSGVDFAHVQGLSELNDQLTRQLQTAAETQRLGIEIEQAQIESAEPPVRVKADFLDVSNARAEQARSVQESRTWAEQRISQAESARQRQIYEAEAMQQASIATAQGSADRFRHLLARMHEQADRPGGDYQQVRDLTVQRMSWQTLQEVWPKIRKKTVINSEGPVDIGVFSSGKP
ncbi:MAG: protease modulator HflK [Planctomycetaceae bacterium]